MTRLGMPEADRLTPAQAQACAEAVAGKRGKVPAPMTCWLHSPELARRAQALGEMVRFDTTLEPHLCEMAILLCARHWTAHVEWNAHKALALKAGLDPQVISDIAATRRPGLADDRARAVYDVATTLLATGRVPSPMYDQALAALGERGLVELVGVLGYYCLVSLTLNTFEVGLPESVAHDLQDPAYAGDRPGPEEAA
ncbi:carboxymuconolactone decarboxylase family protein [Variovorax paradoxus]|nr:carboxymuconolactone decarboxylase family protein [Variovorax paradoxus]MBT2305199.1 carboxymuconolactone decarboxylase family protein [Variovorax paradoxus]